MNVVMAGGGTAGHVFPALAVAMALRDEHDALVTYVGGRDGQEARLVPAAGFPFVGLEVASAQSRVSLHTLRAVWLALRGSRECGGLVREADVVVSIGGFASAPAVVAARRAHRPLVLIEPNTVPGLVNKIAARWADAVAITFEATRPRLPTSARIERTGNPIRPEIVAVRDVRERLRAEAAAAWDLDPARTTVLVVGGSQGARHLDGLIAEGLPTLADRRDLQLLVSAGPANVAIVADAIDERAAVRVRAVGFIDRMDRALAIADVAVSRAGASVAELAACGVPAILVPYPHATENHQEANARELVDAGACRILLEGDLSPSALSAAILELVDAQPARETMTRAMLAWARPDAAERIARLALEVAESRA